MLIKFFYKKNQKQYVEKLFFLTLVLNLSLKWAFFKGRAL